MNVTIFDVYFGYLQFLWKKVYLSVSELIDESSAAILQLTEDYI